jgi:hypothetical protein
MLGTQSKAIVIMACVDDKIDWSKYVGKIHTIANISGGSVWFYEECADTTMILMASSHPLDRSVRVRLCQKRFPDLADQFC